jgi:AbrB family looped-hinge helix DNA binding protein
MPSMMATIDKAGRVVIPKEIRDRLSLVADSEIEVTCEADAIVIRPFRRAGRRVVEIDGWPVLEAVEGLSITDSDVQRWRDADQR